MNKKNRIVFARAALLAMAIAMILTGCQWNSSDDPMPVPKEVFQAFGTDRTMGQGMCCAPRGSSEGKGDKNIKGVMQNAMKGGLCGRVASGKASDEDKKRLVELFTNLAANKCPKGDEKSWKEKTTALLEAAKSGDGDALKKAANCRGCHSEHKS